MAAVSSVMVSYGNGQKFQIQVMGIQDCLVQLFKIAY